MNHLFAPFFLLSPILLGVIVLWSVFWKGMALWRAAQRKEAGWFIALLVINTAGIFEIIYLLATASEKEAKKRKK